MSILEINQLDKTYASGLKALDGIDLCVETGEIFALLGPNGAGKTTLISIICGLVTPSTGEVKVDGYDIITEFRAARQRIGLVPQELAVDGFESVMNTVRFSRALYGLPKNDAYLESVLKSLSLWDKRDAPCQTLSGGMKRRVLIAKALAHEPKLLFLDEPTAGVDVSLRKDMWAMMRELRARGTTIILTTHYIEEAEEMADRVGIINGGKLLLVEKTEAIMSQMGTKEMIVQLEAPLAAIPPSIASDQVELISDGRALRFTYDTRAAQTGIRSFFAQLSEANIAVADIETHQSSLEDIFVKLVGEEA